MGKIAFVFSGQGAQFSGMGKELAEQSAAAKQVFDTVDEVRPGTSTMCFEGSEEDLKETKNTQPCMFAVEMAIAAELEARGIKADMTAGFSLGEIAALTYAGVADLQTGFELVCKRGELMQKDAEAMPAGMVAALKLTEEQIVDLCKDIDDVYPVNYNCPGQVSIAGTDEALEAFSAAAKEAGGRCMPLKVRGGFHSPFMAEASEGFAQALKQAGLQEPRITLYSDFTGEPYEGDMVELLSKQICNPVRWERIIRSMIDEGVDTFIEVGPGKVLCGLIKKISKDVRTFTTLDEGAIEKIVQEV